MSNLNVEWNNRTNKATGFTSAGQADRFIKSICQKAAPNIPCEIITLIPP